MTETREITAGIYARISQDDQGDMLGVRRQERDARELVERKGWTVAEVFIDDDVSAWTGRKRPAYERMLKAIEAGQITAVAVYDLDRLHRQPRDLERFFDVCDRAGVRDLASVAGDVDLASSDGRMLARIMGAVAAKSSDDTSRRIKRKLEDLAAEGRHVGPRPFGYAPDGVTIIEAEAAALRQGAEAVLAGASLADIARAWNAAKVTTSRRAVSGWSGSTVKQVLTGPHQAGLRRHRGEIIGNGAWPGIFTRAEHERLVAALDGPRQRKPGRTSLLTGLVRCGVCGEKMARGVASRGRSVWRCHGRPGYPNCGRLMVAALPIEALITEAVLVALDGPEFGQMMSGAGFDDEDAAAADELAVVEGRLLELAETFAAGEIDKAEWMRARQGLEARVTAARAVLRRRERSGALAAYVGPGALREAWPGLDENRRRAVITAVIDHVTITPAARQGPRFDPNRVDVTWRA